MNVDDLVIEAANDKADINSKDKTNNIINSILPFDLKESVEFTANYLEGYKAEKRDLNYEDLKEEAYRKTCEIAKQGLKKDKQEYDGGIEWNDVNVDVKGSKWLSVYVPVWLYSFLEKDTNVLHYIAVNGRTGKSMSSIPIDKKELKRQNRFAYILFALMFSPIYAITLYLSLFISLLGIILFVAEIIGTIVLVKALVKKNINENYRKIDEKYNYEKNTQKAYFDIQKEDNKK